MGKVFLAIFLRSEPDMRPQNKLELATRLIQFEVVVCNQSKCFCFLDLNRKF